MKVTILNKPNSGLPRWMKLVDPVTKKDSVLILKGHFPQYIFELSAGQVESDSILYSFRNSKFYITVRKDIDNFGAPPERFLVEMCTWYKNSRIRPTLQRISSVA
ncbi:hypothetical protein [Salmonirosea aquatica]|uniref:Uncharacterized protein n=1 Tax=Salmonirosea aquatica TaxID=2654236 RepID=A0A7C9FYC2_9BACT|nr:hypothetical protein [Cytophagaceae bacterium SJW1-29]